jgi:hypothetical protein
MVKWLVSGSFGKYNLSRLHNAHQMMGISVSTRLIDWEINHLLVNSIISYGSLIESSQNDYRE